MTKLSSALTLACLHLLAVGCDCGARAGFQCYQDNQCAAGFCVAGYCRATRDDAATDGTVVDAAVDSARSDACIRCGTQCCGANQRCSSNVCIADFGPCTSNDDCRGDSYCDVSVQRCTQYGVPPTMVNDNMCGRPRPDSVTPARQCVWNQSAILPTFTEVYSTPMVADFNLDNDVNRIAPSIVFTAFNTDNSRGDSRRIDGGVLRIIDGRTCMEQATLSDGANRLIAVSQLAVGDLDRATDTRPEIVAVGFAFGEPDGHATGLVAFHYNATSMQFERLWYGRRCGETGEPQHEPAGLGWYGGMAPSIHDLNDDGSPEIIWDKYVYDANGCVLNPNNSFSAYRAGLGAAVVADVDNDGAPELAYYDGVYRWDDSAHDWALESYFQAGDVSGGFVAVADLGDFPGARGDAPNRAEIVVVGPPDAFMRNGRVRVMSVGGQTVFGPIEIPGGGHGGSPTIADFDGDGHREIGVAGASTYSVFDLDCIGLADSGCARRAGQAVEGVLWSRPSQDQSSNATGSSVFDFDGDGSAEVVYRDECFLRVYRGTNGDVVYSAGVSSGTGIDYPVVADVDGDFNSEIVVPSTRIDGYSCPSSDPIAPVATPSADSSGIIVLRDTQDRWMPSRPIWNQYAYSVTNVSDQGAIPRTSMWQANHRDPMLNNYRINTQGSLTGGIADLTVRLSTANGLCNGETDTALELGATVCNRGTNPVEDGAVVRFYQGDPSLAQVACETRTVALLRVGTCEDVQCTWNAPNGSDITNLTVVVDPENRVPECRNQNNLGVVPEVLCALP